MAGNEYHGGFRGFDRSSMGRSSSNLECKRGQGRLGRSWTSRNRNKHGDMLGLVGKRKASPLSLELSPFLLFRSLLLFAKSDISGSDATAATSLNSTANRSTGTRANLSRSSHIDTTLILILQSSWSSTSTRSCSPSITQEDSSSGCHRLGMEGCARYEVTAKSSKFRINQLGQKSSIRTFTSLTDTTSSHRSLVKRLQNLSSKSTTLSGLDFREFE